MFVSPQHGIYVGKHVYTCSLMGYMYMYVYYMYDGTCTCSYACSCHPSVADEVCYFVKTRPVHLVCLVSSHGLFAP